MYELMKLKYQSNRKYLEIFLLVDIVLGDLYNTLISSSFYCPEELIKKITCLKEIDLDLYLNLLNDIKNNSLLKREV